MEARAASQKGDAALFVIYKGAVDTKAGRDGKSEPQMAQISQRGR
jgi:hypothetical protein